MVYRLQRKTILVILLIGLQGTLGSTSEESASESLFSSKSCADCFWEFYGENYYNCLNACCHEEILSKSILFSTPPSSLSPCSSCLSTNSELWDFSCLSAHCKQEILTKSLDLLSTYPSSLTKKLPIQVSSCESCYKADFDNSLSYDCFYKNCKTEVLKETQSLTSYFSQSNCGLCAVYTDSKFYNCAYFNCKAEIMYWAFSQPEASEIATSCLQRCYWKNLYNDEEYQKCAKSSCKSLDEVSLRGYKNSYCDACYYYYTGDKLNECTAYYCNGKGSQRLNRQDLSYKTNENKYFIELWQDEDDIENQSVSECLECIEKYEGTDRYEDCVLYYCRNDLVDKFSKEFALMAEKMQCSKYCQGFVDDDNKLAGCLADFCPKVAVEVYKIYAAENIGKRLVDKKDKQKTCGSCFFKEEEKEKNFCFVDFCKEEVVDKVLKSDKTNEQCLGCSSAQGKWYDKCLYMYCKDEIAQQALEYSIKTSPETKLQGLDSNLCQACMEKTYPISSLYTYTCLLNNCQDLIQKTDLFTNGKSGLETCDNCFSLSGTKFYNCIYWNCKSQILEKSQELFNIKDQINSNTCTDSCYYDWYYYQYDYHVCVYEYCVGSSNKQDDINLVLVPESFTDKSPKLECSDTCDWYSNTESEYYDCIWLYCKDMYKNSLIQGLEELSEGCGKCVDQYKDGMYEEGIFYSCCYSNCNEEILLAIDNKENGIKVGYFYWIPLVAVGGLVGRVVAEKIFADRMGRISYTAIRG